MAIASTAGVFSREVFSGTVPQTKQKAAAAGFAQIFTTMLAKEMRQSMVGEDNGPMGISGGATGDIYGAFLDQAMGKALANSKSMSRFRHAIDREIGGPHQPGSSPKITSLALARSTGLSGSSGVSSAATTNAVSPNYTGVTMPTDAHGPMLLPPSPSSTAPVLLTPPPSEG
ncbi:MAG TPA: rod-binding protein [Candidatus Binataceae bacterium]|nr:rod-binding protein [Candidatus Binataceae bacterium]